MSDFARTMLWGRLIGVLELPDDSEVARFEFDADFAASGIEVAPIQMPLRPAGRVFSFPTLAQDSFHGLPGMLSDSLPDDYGNALIDQWLASRGRSPGSMNAVERLCYVGSRGMGALEFEPAVGPVSTRSHEIDLEALVELAGEVLSRRSAFEVSFETDQRKEALQEILRIGSSAGGARAKALIAFHPETNEVRSGQIEPGSGFEHWILKFDGVEDTSRELGNARGYGAVEFAYSQMAAAAGIEMSECRLLQEGDRRHFMTRRFDRPVDGGKLHRQSLAALAHLDYRQVRAHSYEQAFHILRQLRLDAHDRDQLFRRMVFNIVARNQDDHVKNIAFLMDRAGQWRLSPAFDVTYAYNPATGRNTAHHQMSVNGMFDAFTVQDLVDVGEIVPLPSRRAKAILGEVTEAAAQWRELADAAGVPPRMIESIAGAHRLELATRRAR